MRYLLENQGTVLSREKILEKIWGYEIYGETRTVDVHIRTLRQKLGEAGKMIETVRGVGYRIGEENMRQRIMSHVTVLVVLSVLLTYLAASLVLYHKYRGDMQADVIKEAEYIRYALENVGEEYLAKDLGQLTTSRITVLNSQGEKVYDSNPGKRPGKLWRDGGDTGGTGPGNRPGSPFFRNAFLIRPFIMRFSWKTEISSG